MALIDDDRYRILENGTRATCKTRQKCKTCSTQCAFSETDSENRSCCSKKDKTHSRGHRDKKSACKQGRIMNFLTGGGFELVS